jgi:hypothetical protein
MQGPEIQTGVEKNSVRALNVGVESSIGPNSDVRRVNAAGTKLINMAPSPSVRGLKLAEF